MGRKPKYTREAFVKFFAEYTHAHGAGPTQEVILNELGGSASTVARHMKELRAAEEEKQDKLQAVLPDQIERILAELAEEQRLAAVRLYGEAKEHSHRFCAAEMAEAAKREQAAALKINELEDALTESEARADQTVADLKTSLAKIEEQRKALAELERGNAVLSAKIEAEIRAHERAEEQRIAAEAQQRTLETRIGQLIDALKGFGGEQREAVDRAREGDDHIKLAVKSV